MRRLVMDVSEYDAHQEGVSRGLVIGIAVGMFLAVMLVASVVARGAVSDAVGISYRSDSTFQLALTDGGIVYPVVEFHLFSQVPDVYSVSEDGAVRSSGPLDGAQIVNVTFQAGSRRIEARIGVASWVWNVVVANRSAEDQVADIILAESFLRITPAAYLAELVRVHAVTLAFFFVPAPFVFRWVIRRKEREVRSLV